MIAIVLTLILHNNAYKLLRCFRHPKQQHSSTLSSTYFSQGSCFCRYLTRISLGACFFGLDESLGQRLKR